MISIFYSENSRGEFEISNDLDKIVLAVLNRHTEAAVFQFAEKEMMADFHEDCLNQGLQNTRIDSFLYFNSDWDYGIDFDSRDPILTISEPGMVTHIYRNDMPKPA